MKIHHLNCATMCPPSPRILQGEGPLLGFSRLVCHCLLIEGKHGLILVDTGLGTPDLAHPKVNLGAGFLAVARPTLTLAETALHQVRALGFSAADVRHIVLTHLDLDHAGGLPDFPDAAVHVMSAEHDAATQPRSLPERERYRPMHWAHGPKWALHTTAGEHWRGFESVRALPDTDDEVLMLPLPGHTRGHACVAVNATDGWLVHCGDAYFFRGEVDPARPHSTPGLSLFQKLVFTTRDSLAANHARLQRLVAEHGRDMAVFCAHDPVEHAFLAGDGAVSPPPGLRQRAKNTR
ncbi:MAG: MBL fold metallo-hydrolase [Tetrasphaera sp.]